MMIDVGLMAFFVIGWMVLTEPWDERLVNAFG
jgi:hypothetical protein